MCVCVCVCWFWLGVGGGVGCVLAIVWFGARIVARYWVQCYRIYNALIKNGVACFGGYPAMQVISALM